MAGSVTSTGDERHHDPFHSDKDASPLTPEERAGLKLSWVTFRSELNEVEEANIAKAALWARRYRRDTLEDRYCRELHRRMFGDVWTWAGRYRTSERNIGVDAWRIATEVRTLFDDVRFWIEGATFEPDEIAARFHHRLVYIHPFPNGNGRHSRLMADLLVTRLGRPVFTWGGANLLQDGDARRAYIDALLAADRHDVGPLLTFVRS
jgi:Fic-DOC domain mobile mystery protein B